MVAWWTAVALAGDPKLPVTAPTVHLAGRAPLRHFAGFATEAEARAAAGCDPAKAGAPFVVVLTPSGAGPLGAEQAWGGPNEVPAGLGDVLKARGAAAKAAAEVGCKVADGVARVLVVADVAVPYARLRAVAAAAEAAGFDELGLLVHADAIASAPVAPTLGAKHVAKGVAGGWQVLPVDEPPPSIPEVLPAASHVAYKVQLLGDPRRPFVLDPLGAASLADVAGVWSALGPVSACVRLDLAPDDEAPAANGGGGALKLEREVSVLWARLR